jgi:hypothetical protein
MNLPRWAFWLMNIAVIAGVAQPARAQGIFMTGNDLAEVCSSSSPNERGICQGYIMGALDSIFLGLFKCSGMENVKSTQMADVVRKFLRDNPADRNKNAYTLVGYALIGAFKCQSIKSPK